MREIKFRQLVKGIVVGEIKKTGQKDRRGFPTQSIETNEGNSFWHYWGFIDGGFTSPQNNKIESQQFTGLLDKSGKEIFEGDIVSNRIHNYSVAFGTYSGYHAGFYLHLKDSKYDIDYPICPNLDLEVIGNIYENPELLTPTL